MSASIERGGIKLSREDLNKLITQIYPFRDYYPRIKRGEKVYQYNENVDPLVVKIYEDLSSTRMQFNANDGWVDRGTLLRLRDNAISLRANVYECQNPDTLAKIVIPLNENDSGKLCKLCEKIVEALDLYFPANLSNVPVNNVVPLTHLPFYSNIMVPAGTTPSGASVVPTIPPPSNINVPPNPFAHQILQTLPPSINVPPNPLVNQIYYPQPITTTTTTTLNPLANQIPVAVAGVDVDDDDDDQRGGGKKNTRRRTLRKRPRKSQKRHKKRSKRRHSKRRRILLR